ncbi:MAG: hypothetical protein HGB19_00495 [Chlorobiales bacterium]|jgi:hypothetical protein|nr:hypothetical protein [Chlorobiales bacterium]
MTLIQLLETRSESLISEATEALSRAHLKHYEQAGLVESQKWLETLYNLTLQSIKTRDLSDLLSHVEKISVERFSSGFDLHEVQMAFNVVEEVIWGHILKDLDPSDYAEALGLVSTALGEGKDTLAMTYVSLASKRKVPTLDLSGLFTGTGRE